MNNLLRELLDENGHRSYPLDDLATALDSTGVFRIPTTFMLNMQISIPYDAEAPATDPGRFYVSSVVVRGFTADVLVSYTPDGSTDGTVVGAFRGINIVDALPAGEYRSSSLVPADQMEYPKLRGASGTLTTGLSSELIRGPGSWEFAPEAGLISRAAVDRGWAKFSSLEINGERLRGNIILQPDAGVRLRVETDPDTETTTITIGVSKSPAGTALVDDASVLDALIALNGGSPVLTVNNIKPDDSGNLSIRGLDCVEVAGGSGYVSISNPAGKPCCDGNTEMETLYANISELNTRIARLQQSHAALSATLADFSSLLGLSEEAG